MSRRFGDLGHLIGRGALISMLFVCSLMPAFLVLFDHILMQNEFERIHLFFKKRRERHHARMKRAARRVAGAVWKGKSRWWIQLRRKENNSKLKRKR